MNIYLDSISTTPVAPEVVEAMAPFWREQFGNASSIHQFGRQAIIALDRAREAAADFFGVTPGEICFTSSATEADNLALYGIARGVAKKSQTALGALHIVVSAIEHKAVLAMAQNLENEGVSVTYLTPNKEGFITAESVSGAIKPNTILVSVMYVNNEVGSINDLTKIGRVIEAERDQRSNTKYATRDKVYPIYFHTDAVQAVQFLDCRLDYIKADALTFSGHKIYGPKGVGGLVIRANTPLSPLIVGGGQEDERRSGTENVPAIVGLGEALKLVKERRVSVADQVSELQQEFWQALNETVPKIKLNGPALGGKRIINNLNVCFKGADAESLVIALDLEGVAVSSGAACAAGAATPSHVLKNLGLSKADIKASVRFSLGRQTTRAEIAAVIKLLPALVARVRG